MKKIILFFLTCISLYSFSSCWHPYERNDLNEYAEDMRGQGIGYSSVEIDLAEYFLPAQTFIDDYKYIDGGYYCYEGIFRLIGDRCSKCILHLKYDEINYKAAKMAMLEGIPPEGKTIYSYDSYNFYENENFIKRFDSYDTPGSRFPSRFTMACYNDKKQVLVFIGYDANLQGEITQENFKAFIDETYGEYYDFSK